MSHVGHKKQQKLNAALTSLRQYLESTDPMPIEELDYVITQICLIWLRQTPPVTENLCNTEGPRICYNTLMLTAGVLGSVQRNMYDLATSLSGEAPGHMEISP